MDGMGASLFLKQIQRDVLGANHIYHGVGEECSSDGKSLQDQGRFLCRQFGGSPRPRLRSLASPRLLSSEAGPWRCAGQLGGSEEPCAPLPAVTAPLREVTKPLEQPDLANENTGCPRKFQK